MSNNQLIAERAKISPTAFVHESVIIRGLNGLAKNIEIGDNTYIGHGVEIICDDFRIGDYGKIHHHTNIHGKKVHIGHNAWIGQFCILDGMGGLEIRNNVGIGAQSQIWSHIKFGDTLEGCQYNRTKECLLMDDVWMVGCCHVSPIVAQDRSMALLGSVITQDMNYNQIYAGVPAKPLLKRQFDGVMPGEKKAMMKIYLDDFYKSSGIKDKGTIQIVEMDFEADLRDEITYFCLQSRCYKKTRSIEEQTFIKYLLPEKAKFVPLN